MTRTAPGTKEQLAADVWRAMFKFFMATRAQRDQVLARFGMNGLTPNDAKALFSLQPGEGRPMGALSQEWTCDPSNATWIVDRLEERGLAERQSAPGDRRVKLVVLTPLGVKTRRKLMERMFEPPAELMRLERDDLLALRRALAKLSPNE